MGGELKLTPICVHFILVEGVLPVSASDRFVFNLNICGWQVTASQPRAETGRLADWLNSMFRYAPPRKLQLAGS